MCLDRRGKGGICAHRGLTHLDGPDSYLAVDDTEIGSGARIPLWMFGARRTVDKVTDTGLGGVVSGMLFHEKVVKRRPKVIVWLEV